MTVHLQVRAQTLLDLQKQVKNVDFTSALSTKPFKTGTSMPAQCLPSEVFFNTTAPAGNNLYICTAPNIWTQLAGPGGNGSYLAGLGLFLAGNSFSIDVNTVAGLRTANTFYSLNDFSAGQIRIQAGVGAPPASQCSGVPNAGKLYARTDVSTSPLYVCAQTAASVFSWIGVTGASSGSFSSPLAIKGDLLGFDSTNARVPVGLNGQVLTADSNSSVGIAWKTPTSGAGPIVQRIPLGWYMPGQGVFAAPGVYAYSLSQNFGGIGTPGVHGATFSTSGTDRVVVTASIPSANWSGTLKLRGRQSTEQGGSGTVIYNVASGCATDGSGSTAALGTTQNLTSDVVTGQWKIWPALTLTTGSCSPGDTLYISITRVGGTYGNSIVVPDITVEM